MDVPIQEIFGQIWSHLEAGAASSHSPWHIASVATVEDGEPRVRAVVLRGARRDPACLWFHTDWRSPKYSQLSRNPAIELLFYSPSDRVQIRARGRATLHHRDAVAHEAWEASKLTSRRCYLAPAPGAASAAPSDGLPDAFRHRVPSAEESAAGRENFVVVRCAITVLDWYQLSAQSARRAQFRLEPGAPPAGTWVTP